MFPALSEAFSEFHWFCRTFRFTSVVSSYNTGCASFGLSDMGSRGIAGVFSLCILGPCIKNGFVGQTCSLFYIGFDFHGSENFC